MADPEAGEPCERAAASPANAKGSNGDEGRGRPDEGGRVGGLPATAKEGRAEEAREGANAAAGSGERGAPSETNEEAMLRLIAKDKGKGSEHRGERRASGGYKGGYDEGRGGKRGGKDKGRGGGKMHGPPPSTDTISSERRADLKSELEAFAAGPEVQLVMPASTTGLERKYLHEVAGELGLVSQSFGVGKDRHLSIFKSKPGGAGAQPSSTDGAADESTALAPDGGGDVGAFQGRGPVLYSSVALEESSIPQLLEFCGRAFNGGIPEGWKVHSNHMTICMGSLAMPLTEDNRSVADLLRGQIGELKEGQKVDFRVVSTGQADGVLAVGVVGCVSCNRNPHVTVATAKGVGAVASNRIRLWKTLPPDDQLKLRGVIRQHRQGQHADQPLEPPPSEPLARAAQELELEPTDGGAGEEPAV